LPFYHRAAQGHLQRMIRIFFELGFEYKAWILALRSIRCLVDVRHCVVFLDETSVGFLRES
jgi:hypothetical protein